MNLQIVQSQQNLSCNISSILEADGEESSQKKRQWLKKFRIQELSEEHKGSDNGQPSYLEQPSYCFIWHFTFGPMVESFTDYRIFWLFQSSLFWNNEHLYTYWNDDEHIPFHYQKWLKKASLISLLGWTMKPLWGSLVAR